MIAVNIPLLDDMEVFLCFHKLENEITSQILQAKIPFKISIEKLICLYWFVNSKRFCRNFNQCVFYFIVKKLFNWQIPGE